jgi:hypothetical protein
MSDDSALLSRVESLLAEIEGWPDDARTAGARRLVNAVLALHGAALGRMLAAAEAEGGEALPQAMARDELVSSVLLIHDIHPLPLAERVEGALAKLGLEGQGASVRLEWTEPTELVAHLSRVPGKHAASGEHVRELVERALLVAAPDLTALSIDVAGLAAGFVSIDRLRASAHKEVTVS